MCGVGLLRFFVRRSIKLGCDPAGKCGLITLGLSKRIELVKRMSDD